MDTDDTEWARRTGKRDAKRAITVARQVSYTGTHDPRELRNFDPRNYVDSAELPARRIATEWGVKTLPDFRLTPLARFADEALITDSGDEVWEAYESAVYAAVEEAEVGLFETAWKPPNPDGVELPFIHSLYVADLSRYEWLGSPAYLGRGDMFSEDYIQRGFMPRDLGRIARWRWKREHRQWLDHRRRF